MSTDIRNVKDLNGLIAYFADKLQWNIDLDDFDDIEDIAYDFDAEDIGLKEEAFARIKTLLQLPPLVDGQKWGIFCVEFDSRHFEVTALRKILSGLIPKRRNATDHAVWEQKDLLFLCFWGRDNDRTIGIAHFEDKESGLPTIKMISCAPAVEDFTQIRIFENRLKSLKWPMNYMDHAKWQEDWSSAFTTGYKETIQNAAMLTTRLAIEAQGIRNRILDILKVETANGYVHLLYEKFKDTLIHEMTETQFADMYAQTVVYGLFSARCMDDTQDDFSASEAVDCIPNTNPFLKSLMQECLGAQNTGKLSFDELEIGNVVELLLHTKTDSIIQDFNRQTGGGKEDPVIHFYEEFLTAYDKQQKVQRGVYYTPQPVVYFIVRAVDSIIKTEFGLEDGLASTATKKIKYKREAKKKTAGKMTKGMVEDTKEVPAIQVLDPATGTGTFIRQTILQIYENFKEKNKSMGSQQLHDAWNDYVPKHLLPRINAFELMMAPYAVAHMKLAMVLKDTGYDFKSNERLNVFLTNTLEEPGDSDNQMTLWSDPLAMESIAANAVKKNKAINICIGNPPYAGMSANKGEWISKAIEPYKREPGVFERLHERNPKWINDDYVKFTRICEMMLEEQQIGILAFINNHAFIDNPTFRGMRYHLLQTFDQVYILDLHGNIMRKETTADGGKDENVFDIQQGVSINIYVRTGKTKARGNSLVYHADLFGSREYKYDVLSKMAFYNINWKLINPNEPHYLFIERNEDNRKKYEEGFSIKELMPVNTSGIVTSRDNLVIDKNRERLIERIKLFQNPNLSDDFVREKLFGNKQGRRLAGDTADWNMSKARKESFFDNIESMVKKIEYRPFDTQYIYYNPKLIDRDRATVMCHFLKGKNYGLIIPRQAATDNWSHAQITRYMADNRVHYSNKGIPIECPLYTYEEIFGKIDRRPNLNMEIIDRLCESLGMSYVPDRDDESSEFVTPVNLMDYIYAVLYSNKYRQRYLEFLKYDFPRIPYPNKKKYYIKMASFGERLRMLHTDESNDYDQSYGYMGNDSPLIQKPKFKNNTVFINSDGDSFRNIPEDIWNMYFGGYQPLQKWLKDRKNQYITAEEVAHYLHIVSVLSKTKLIMDQIDNAILL